MWKRILSKVVYAKYGKVYYSYRNDDCGNRSYFINVKSLVIRK